MAGETTIDPLLLDPSLQPLSPSPTNVYDNGTTNASLYPFSGFPFGPKSQPVSFINQVGDADGDRCHSRSEYQRSQRPSDPVTHPSTSLYNIASLTTPSGVLPPGDVPNEQKIRSAKSKNETSAPTNSTMQLLSTERTDKSSPKTRRQSRRETTKARGRPIAQPKEKRTRNRRQRSLEKNRVAASKCRKRKKQWVDNLEQRKSGLESIHHELQTEYMKLLNETSVLKDYIIRHACCQDANIGAWINDEASKYAHTLRSANRMNSIHSIRSVDGKSANHEL